MRTLHNAVMYGLAGLGSIFWISLAVVATVFTFNRDIALVMARRLWAPTMMKIAGGKLVVDPLPDVDWSKPHIFLMNHQSVFDIPAAFAALPANLRFVAKHTLKYVPFLGWYMWMTGMVFINRGRREKAFASLQQAGAQIRKGCNILAYPEGTRSRDGEILPMKKGAFVLALEAQVPVIPVAIEGSINVLPPDGIERKPGVVRLKVGKPIETKGRTADDRDALMAEVATALSTMTHELRARRLAESASTAAAPQQS